MQLGHLPLLHSRSGQSDGETAQNFYTKFELDCTRCLWNNYHSEQAQITLLDVGLIFMIMMKWSEKNVCEENKMCVRKTKYINMSNRSSHIYFLQSDYSTVICVASYHCLKNVRRPMRLWERGSNNRGCLGNFFVPVQPCQSSLGAIWSGSWVWGRSVETRPKLTAQRSGIRLIFWLELWVWQRQATANQRTEGVAENDDVDVVH